MLTCLKLFRKLIAYDREKCKHKGENLTTDGRLFLQKIGCWLGYMHPYQKKFECQLGYQYFFVITIG